MIGTPIQPGIASATAPLTYNAATGTIAISGLGAVASYSPAMLGVAQYNAKALGTIAGDGTTDDTAAIQAALNAVGADGGGTLYLPSSNYLIAGQLSVPIGVTLRGTYNGPLSHVGLLSGAPGPTPTGGGTTLLLTGNAGSTAATLAAITLATNGTIQNLCIFYPNQVAATATAPIQYPPAIAARGGNCTVENVELLNPYIGIDINNANGNIHSQITYRANVRGVTGQPLFVGIQIGTGSDTNQNGTYVGILDVCRIENVHFNPWYTDDVGNLYAWQANYGTAFLVGDVDSISFVGCFAYGYWVGLHLTAPTRGSYGTWVGQGFDGITGAAVYCEGNQITGWTFSGCQLVVVSSTGNGVLMSGGNGQMTFNGCHSWGGPSSRFVMKTGGSGAISFSGCRFSQYSLNPQVQSGRLMFTGCDFTVSGTTITTVGSASASASCNSAATSLALAGTASGFVTGTLTY